MSPPAAIRCAQVHRSSPQVHEMEERRHCRIPRGGPQSVRNNDTPGSGKWEGVIMAVAEAPGLPVGECAHAVTVSISQDIECFEPEPRCRVCRSDGLSKRVNDMLARGASYAGIVRALSLRERRTRRARPGHGPLGAQPRRPTLPGAERSEGDLPGDTRAPRAGERCRLRRTGWQRRSRPMAFFETVMVRA